MVHVSNATWQSSNEAEMPDTEQITCYRIAKKLLHIGNKYH
jgi:hypothetical protein